MPVLPAAALRRSLLHASPGGAGLPLPARPLLAWQKVKTIKEAAEEMCVRVFSRINYL